MADRPGFGEVRRGGPSVGVSVIPGPPQSNASARKWGILANALEGVSVDAHRRYDRQVAVKAQEAGVQDALDGRVRKLDRSTTRGAAYHDAAISTMVTQAETSALLATQDLYRQFSDNPAELQRALDLYAEGALDQINAVSPEAAVALQQRMVANSIPMVNGAIENRERGTAALLKFERERAEGAEQITIAAHAPNVFSPDPQQSSASVAGVLAARGRVSRLRSEEASEGFLLNRLTNGHGSAHIVNMQGPLKTRLAAMIANAPPEISEGLQIGSGFRSIDRQRELWEASDKTGRTVARPGFSQHNHGNAADLYWKGQRLDKAPETVRAWVRKNASAYGLKLPMDYEPWHVEVTETRGGPAFEGDVPGGAGEQQGVDPDGIAAGAGSDDILAAYDQDFYDQVIGSGFKSWFASQTDRVGAYIDFVEGKTELPMFMPDGSRVAVNVRNRLSAKAADEIEGQLRERIRMDTSLREAAEARDRKELDLRSAQTRADFITGIFGAGETFELPEGQRVAQKPTAAELRTALDRGLLTPGDYEVLFKAAMVEAPVRSDEGVKREAFRMARGGIDPEGYVLENLHRLTAEDARAAVNDFATLQDKAAGLDRRQAEYLNQLDRALSPPPGAMSFLDPGQPERRANAVLEMRERMTAGEEAGAVYRDILERSRLSDQAAMAGVRISMPRPRFSVPDPAAPENIDVMATYQALKTARADGWLDEQELLQQVLALEEWDALQQALAAAPPPKAK